ncbi:hypothetical protein LCGC14_0566040 [marine sediment metagenome]|uniref:Uncharacterized protein n=1 Tax=marine sediment metagenome TaxID=412755 RepID=A0A0F9S483_9ZZZZ
MVGISPNIYQDHFGISLLKNCFTTDSIQNNFDSLMEFNQSIYSDTVTGFITLKSSTDLEIESDIYFLKTGFCMLVFSADIINTKYRMV